MAGKSNKVTIPRTYKSGPNSHRVRAIYATDPEIGLLRSLDMHNSGIGTENHYGPGGLLNMDGGGAGDDIGRKIDYTLDDVLKINRVTLPTGTRTKAGGTPLGTKTNQRSQPTSVVYAGPGHRTNTTPISEKVPEWRKDVFPEGRPSVTNRPSQQGTPGSGDTGNGDPPNGNGTPPNGNGTPPSGNGTPPSGNGTPPSGGTPGVGTLGTGARQTYTGPTMLNPQWSVIGRQNLAPYMPPKGMLDYTPQASLVADRGRLYDMFAGGQRHRYSPPTGLNYIPQYAGRPESTVVENPEVVVEETPSYHDTYMDPTNPMGHYAALWRTGGQYSWDGNRWSYNPGGGPWAGVGGATQPTSRTLADLLRSLGGNKTTAKPNVSANATSAIVPTNVGGIFDY